MARCAAAKPVKNLDKTGTEWLRGMSARFFMGGGTETLLQDILDARFGSRKKETSKEVGEGDDDPRVKVRALS